MNQVLLGALGPLAAEIDTAVRDLCVASDGSVWTNRGVGFNRSAITLSPLESRRIGVGLVEMGGGRVDDAKPYGDGALAGDIRVHVVLPPVSRGGAAVSLRFPMQTPVNFEDYLVPKDWDWNEIANSSVVITGATGSGKTTLLSLLVSLVPADQRIVAIEDIPELDFRHPHVTALTTREANQEGAGELTMAKLVRESLRMRPDRIVVGEVRGVEVRDMLMALSTGHRGFTTLHANSAGEAHGRIATLASLAGMSLETVSGLLSTAIDYVVHCERGESGKVRLQRSRISFDEKEAIRL